VEREQIKMYSDYKSPFAFLAFDPAFELEERYRVSVRWIPFQLRIKGPGERSLYSDYKARYSYLDARRWAKPRGILIRGPLKIYDSRPALIGGLFAGEHSCFLDYSRRVYELFFRRELEIDQPEAIAAVIAQLGMSADEYRTYARTRGLEAYNQAQDEAAVDHVFGVPLFYFEKEPFWGHDRLSVLERRLDEAGLAIDASDATG
jgi:2-hydroxychromene-2-carboxylate isomerase